jgi:hypothetical protein
MSYSLPLVMGSAGLPQQLQQGTGLAAGTFPLVLTSNMWLADGMGLVIAGGCLEIGAGSVYEIGIASILEI